MKHISNEAILKTAKRLLQEHPNDFLWCGEVNYTQLAETVASELNHDEWLDDEQHYVWEAAMSAAIWWTNEK